MGSTVLATLQARAKAAPVTEVLRQPARLPAEIAAELSEGERCALLQMSGRHSVQAVWMKLREQYSAPPFTLSTFVRLRERGLCERPERQKFHRLTVAGAAVADIAARTMVAERNLHASWLGGEDGAFVTLHCVCGWSTGLVRNPRLQLQAATAFTSHMRQVDERAEAHAEGLKTAIAPVCQGIERV